MADRIPVRGVLIYLALAAGGLGYGAKGLYSGISKFQAGEYAGQPRDLVIDIATVLIQLGLGIGLTYLGVRAIREAAQAPDALAICRQCGASLKVGARFCGGCGRPVA